MKTKDWRQILNTGKTFVNEAIEPYGGKVSEIDGKSKQSAINYLHKKLSKSKITSKRYKDEYWKGIQDLWKLFDSMGLDSYITDTKYEKDEQSGEPIRKRYYFAMEYHNGKKMAKIQGQAVAAGAGTVRDPLSVYDVTVNFW